MPLIIEAFNWQHGVYLGATMGSEITAAQYGNQGQTRRDPMAMIPFCGYNMADYFKHWLNMGKKMKKPPKIFHVNWFRQDEKGKFLWPGFGENLRILEWVLERCNNKVSAKKTPIGYIPDWKDIDMTGIKLSKEAKNKLFQVRKDEWKIELNQQKEFFEIFKNKLSKEIRREYNSLKNRIEKSL